MNHEIAELREAHIEFQRMFKESKRHAEREIYDCIRKWVDILEEEYDAKFGGIEIRQVQAYLEESEIPITKITNIDLKMELV